MISIIIRTLNEEKYLSELLQAIDNQNINDEIEKVIIDSGSTDQTLEIAKKFNCNITHIDKKDFTFGKSLNDGCRFSKGDILVFISGHCIPKNSNWLLNLIKPIKEEGIDYIYGRQIGRDTTRFSENIIFKKYFPNHNNPNNIDYFCNNANSAIKRNVWNKYQFNEDLTGLEDMELAKRIFADGLKISYSHKSAVFHIHDENSKQIKNRYEREAIALKEIEPDIKMSKTDFLRYFLTAIFLDFSHAIESKVIFKEFFSIIKFRFLQYLGSYIGTNKSSLNLKELDKYKHKYFYPK
tara:strand:+ start:272 stop:1156 length:885 start_codon:yes stop_codon:yes gene_type:complete